MTNEDQILFESKFTSENISDTDFDKCLAAILATKEISNSAYSVQGNSKLEIVTLFFVKNQNNDFEFNGALSLTSETNSILENRSVSGIITFKGKKTYIIMQIHRYSKCEHEDYEVGEIQEKLKTRTKRTTFYQYIKESFNDRIDLITSEQLLEYKENYIKGLKL